MRQLLCLLVGLGDQVVLAPVRLQNPTTHWIIWFIGLFHPPKFGYVRIFYHLIERSPGACTCIAHHSLYSSGLQCSSANRFRS